MRATSPLLDYAGEIELDRQPAAFVTSDALAARARLRRSSAPYNPDAALSAAEKLAASRLTRGDKLGALRDRGRITAAELAAGREIERLNAWRLSIGGPRVRSQLAERIASGGVGDGGAAEALALIEIEATRFRPWFGYASAYPVRPGLTLAGLTGAAVIEGRGVRTIADAIGMDGRRVLALLRRSLHRYAALAGWQAGGNPPEIEAA